MCSGGNSGHVADSDIDCNGDCFGSALEDSCGVCSGGNSGHVADSDIDCNGDCFGSALEDSCGVCSGGNSGHVADSDIDCNGDCFGSALEDSCGVCSGGNSGHVADSDIDCNGDCFGSAIFDECGVCDGDNSTCSGCLDDLAFNSDCLPGNMPEQNTGCGDNILIDDGSCIYTPTEFNFNQSTSQAFYFIESANLDNEDLAVL